MKNNYEYPTWERPPFLFVITLIGGYMNAYTYVTRDGVLANMHTANMSHLGISLALGQWRLALAYFLPIVACILGAAFSEALKVVVSRSRLAGDWRKTALILEALALLAVGLVPLGAGDTAVTTFVSFVMGFQLCLFRTCLGAAHNTTICTGNIRNVGQKLFAVLQKRDEPSLRIFAIFAALTFSFMIGAIPGTLFSLLLAEKAVWLCSASLLLLTLWMSRAEKRAAGR